MMNDPAMAAQLEEAMKDPRVQVRRERRRREGRAA
jgi:hypothetical protein